MSKSLYLILLVLTDIVAYYLSFALAYSTRSALNYIFTGLPIFEIPAIFFLKQVWIPAILIALLGYAGLYTKRQNFWIDTKCVVKSTIFCLLIILAIITLSKMTDEISRLFVLLLFTYMLFVIPSLRFIIKRLLHKRKIGIETVIVVSDFDNAQSICHLIEGDIYLGYKVGCIFSSKSGKMEVNYRSISVYSSIKWLKRISRIIGASTAFVSLKNDKFINGNVYQIQMVIKNVYVLPNPDVISHLNTEIIQIFQNDTPLLYIKNNLKEPVNILIKRLFDYIVCLLLLPVFTTVLLVVAVFIKMDSRGPVFFKQKRVGRHGIEFYVYKFRTMFVDCDARLKKYLENNPLARKEMEVYCKLKDDPRVTRIGRILRKTSLDELPQLLNVLKGEMSLVGPRPAFKDELNTYYKELAEFYMEVRPGITGLWQVSGRNQLAMKDRARLEAFYVINWSLWLDIVIILKTFKVVLLREGAY